MNSSLISVKTVRDKYITVNAALTAMNQSSYTATEFFASFVTFTTYERKWTVAICSKKIEVLMPRHGNYSWRFCYLPYIAYLI